MHCSAIIACLLASVLASPVPVPAAVANPDRLQDDSNRITIPLDPQTLHDYPQLEKRQGQCTLGYCQQAFNRCVQSCSSLNNGDWYVQYHTCSLVCDPSETVNASIASMPRQAQHAKAVML